VSVSVLFDHSAAILKAIQTMAQKDVLVGIPEAENARKDDPDIGNASLGFINENGSPARNIPARPFLVPGVRAAADRCANVLKVGAQAAFHDPAALDKALNGAGQIARDSVKRRITSQEGFAPLSDATLAARKRRGVTRTNALIDTGALLNSITYVVKDR
jgi:hypothetical protein